MFEKYVIMDINFAEEVKMMTAKAIDYSTYSEQALFVELNSTSEQLEQLAKKKAQIEQALRERAKVPNDKTIKAMQECEKISQNDDIVEIDNVSNYLKGLVSNG